MIINKELRAVLPDDIEKCSMEIITREMSSNNFSELELPIVKRVIHTTADFEYAEQLFFSNGVIEKIRNALLTGLTIITDTNMAWTGINKKCLENFDSKAYCFMADQDIALSAKINGTTRASASMDKAATLTQPLLFAIGNAPTALVRLCELIDAGKISPIAIIGAPVGFVNVVESKRLLMQYDIPQIVVRGRKGGSAVAAAIVNAILYDMKYI